MNYYRLISIALIILFAHFNTWAWPPTYGAEFEVTREELDVFDPRSENPTHTNVKTAQMEFVTHIRNRCLVSKCVVTEVKGKWDRDYVVEYPDGWWFKVSYDPGCVEFTFKPSTLTLLKNKAALINDQIFKTAQDVGLTVDKTTTSHFNMGIRSAFGDDVKRFTRFYVDYTNHAHLALGSIGEDLSNAPTLSVLGPDQRQALQEIVSEVNSNKLKTLQEVIQAIQNRVYTKSYEKSWGGIKHYQAVGLKYAYKADLKETDKPMELRAVRIQESAEKFNMIAKLFEERIKYLATLTGPIVYTATNRTSFSLSELRTRFAIYVEETGLQYENFKELITEEIRAAEYEDFVRNDVSIERRISGIGSYLDLIPASSWVRERTIEILSHPLAQNKLETLNIIEKMKQITEQKNQKLSFFKKMTVRWLKVDIQQTSPEAIQIFENVLKAIEKKSNESTPTNNSSGFANNFSTILSCRNVFAK